MSPVPAAAARNTKNAAGFCIRKEAELKKISDIPKSDRPREKLQQKGAEALSDIELLAILLGRGIEGHDVMSVAARVLKVLDI